MSRTARTLNCTPDDVFDVLEDGWSYATWVVGAARIRHVDESWPAPGSRIYHSVGVWPLLVNDTTSVDVVDRPHEIVLTVRAWPAGEGKVRLTCAPVGDRATEVTIREDASSGPAQLLIKPFRDVMLNLRNVEALRRLGHLAESRARRRDDTHGDGSIAKMRSTGREPR